MITVSEDDDDDVELVGTPPALDPHTREPKSDKTDLKVVNWSPTPKPISVIIQHVVFTALSSPATGHEPFSLSMMASAYIFIDNSFVKRLYRHRLVEGRHKCGQWSGADVWQVL